MKGKLILEDGTVFEGKAFGYLKEAIGEVVFNTSMAGYGELLTDATYYGQIVTMTYPLIGNYGINLEDVESNKVQVKGLIVREKSDNPNNFRCEMDIDTYLKQNKVIGLEGIDTRALTKIIRNNGTKRGIITLENVSLQDVQSKLEEHCNKDSVKNITRKEIENIKGTGAKVVVIDFGVKNSVLESLKACNCDITIVPAMTTVEEILNINPDLILLSNGPGNPEDINDIVENIKKLIGKKPLTGIGLGHQILALALGGKTSKLVFGHRGGNHPVKCLETGKVFITSQNHGYNVSEMPENTEVTHINLNDNTIEGMRHKELPIYSVQYIPEYTTKEDLDCIFNKFLALI
ncbi:TPA: glutamine-hydrolyzing carbamoyl-phosphate synthase small subunit [Clostridioides difficile]|nr:glutamine-hydrolyzing carbamoyl-phosphate synthase small subunit [Clostridioides difficile]HEK8924416.1 glutamine-hydrolyzing carbamoyl-phosphate synthase small subunit [Clostridioides difficile]